MAWSDAWTPLLILDEGADLVVIPRETQMQVAAFHQKQNPHIQPCPELKIFSKRTQADTGMKVRMPKG